MITPEERQKLLDFVNSPEVEQPHKPTKVTELTENDVIHTETEAEYYRICILLHLAGKTWSTGGSYLELNRVIWHRTKIDTCLWPNKGEWDWISYYVKICLRTIPSTQITGV